MKRMLSLCLILAFSLPALADTRWDTITIKDLRLTIPTAWKLHQQSVSQETLISGFEKGDDYVTIFAKSGTISNMKDIFANGSQITENETSEQHGPFKWRVLQAVKNASSGSSAKRYVRAFLTEYRGQSYYGYASSADDQNVKVTANVFLDGIHIPLRSLTGTNFIGKKYYLGWGAAGSGDPSLMQNEVKYDVLHTHNIFTKDIGGNYAGIKYLSYKDATATNVRKSWAEIKKEMNANDMYIQYSSGHGSQSGIGIGLSYTEIRDAALSMPAKEIVIFIMACHAGGLVDSFKSKKSVWENWQKEGRTLMVMSSSKVSQSSSTGPGTDSSEPDGPNGSAGSAFGHALWKALIGEADGEIDGVKDGFLSLGEIAQYTTWKTKKVGGHTPDLTGAYNANLIMNRKPSREWLASLEGGTEDLEDDEIMMRIQELDEAMGVQQ